MISSSFRKTFDLRINPHQLVAALGVDCDILATCVNVRSAALADNGEAIVRFETKRVALNGSHKNRSSQDHGFDKSQIRGRCI